MKTRKYTEEQIIAVPREGEDGARVANLYRKYGMSDVSYCNWKLMYVNLIVSKLRQMVWDITSRKNPGLSTG